jgi:MFS family permease
MKKRRGLTLSRILLLAYLISTFSEGVILPVYAVFVQKIGGDILDAGLALGIFMIGQGLFTFLIHNMKKRTYNQRINLMVIGWFIWLIGIFLYMAVSNKWMLFLTELMLALGNATADPIYEEEFASAAKKKTSEEKEWGLFEGSISFVNGISAIIGGVIASLFGFNILIYSMIITATIAFVLVLYYTKKIKR